MADLDADRANAHLHENQPYDESLEVPDSEDVASTYDPTPRLPARGKVSSDLRMATQSDDEFDTGKDGKAIADPQMQKAGTSNMSKAMYDEDDDDDEDEDSGSDEDDDDEEGGGGAIEGAYDPAEYDHLPVTGEIKQLFEYITRYTPQSIELDTKVKPFIPDFIPAVGDIDAFIKVSLPAGTDIPDGKVGLVVLDEPCAKQSDPTVLDLQLRAISKQTNLKAMVVRSVDNAEKDPRAIDNWIENISELHRSRPPPNVHYTKNMPDIDTLMQEWPAEFEELLKEVGLPTADLDCDLATYTDIICGLLDIPIYKSKVQSLHVLFTLYSEFKNSQHFKSLADENRLDNALKGYGEADRFVL